MEYLKLIDPAARYTWEHPTVPGVRFVFRALAGPTLDRDIARRYLDACIVEAFRVDIPGVGPVEHWTLEAGPPVEWSRVLPADVANALFLAITRVSVLLPEDDLDSRSPSGQPMPETPTTAPAAPARGGSVHDGRTTSRRAAGGQRNG